MRVFLAIFVLIAIATGNDAAEIPYVKVTEGNNVISFIVNNETLQAVDVFQIDLGKGAPDWVKIDTDVVSTQKTGNNEELNIPLTISETDETYADVPFVLTDKLGRRWEVVLGIMSQNHPSESLLLQNIPNPFNPTTTIKYVLNDQAPHNTSLVIYNVNGQAIRHLVNEEQSDGAYEVAWNGKDDAGNMVASGVYVYQLISEGIKQSKRMILLK